MVKYIKTVTMTYYKCYQCHIEWGQVGNDIQSVPNIAAIYCYKYSIATLNYYICTDQPSCFIGI